jgi:TonB family protein
MRGQRIAASTVAPQRSANQRLQDRSTSYVFAAITFSAALHYAAFSVGTFSVPDFRLNTSPPMERIELQRRVEIPPPPAEIARPAMPVVSTNVNIDPDLTIGSVLIRDNPAERLPPPPTPATPDLSEQPVFTPYSVRPELRNADELMRALERSYPQTLKDAGIGGTTLLWVFIDVAGAVQNTRVVETSGFTDLDRIAETVVRATARFSPAYNRDQRVPVWIQIPITFRSLAE